MGLLPLIMSEVFSFNKNSDYILRSGIHLKNSNIHTVYFGSESIGFPGTKI